MQRIDIPVAEPDLSGNEVAYVTDAIQNEKRISSGKYVARFEEHCRTNFGRAYASSASNGTTALHLALLGLGIGPGDEVIVPTFTFIASATAVCHAGATPVFADVDEKTWLVDVGGLEKVRTPKTKAVIAVDLYGMTPDYAALAAWCEAHGLFLIEDAAEAHGARFDGKSCGSFGHASIFSFYGNKILTTGEGGVVLCDDEAVLKRMNMYKNHGRAGTEFYEHDVIGYNYRMTNIQAAIGCAQFERFAAMVAERARHDALYRSLLKHPTIRFPEPDARCEPVCWQTTFRVVCREAAALRAALAQKGIDTRPVFTPLHLLKPFGGAPGTFPVAETIAKEALSLPSSYTLSDADITRVAEAVMSLL